MLLLDVEYHRFFTALSVLRIGSSALGIPAGNVLGDQGPLVAVLLMQLENEFVLLDGELALLHVRIEIVQVPLLALLRVALVAGDCVELLGDVVPVVVVVLLEDVEEEIVLLLRPLLSLARRPGPRDITSSRLSWGGSLNFR